MYIFFLNIESGNYVDSDILRMCVVKQEEEGWFFYCF